MRAKYRALERRMLEVEKVVDRCIMQNGTIRSDEAARQGLNVLPGKVMLRACVVAFHHRPQCV